MEYKNILASIIYVIPILLLLFMCTYDNNCLYTLDNFKYELFHATSYSVSMYVSSDHCSLAFKSLS